MSASDSNFSRSISEKQILPSGGVRMVYTSVPTPWLIRVTGDWQQDGFRIDHVTPGGPASKMVSLDGTLQNVSMEIGDVVVSINDDAILNGIDWTRALINARD